MCPRTYMLAELLGECLLKAHLRNLVIQNEGKHHRQELACRGYGNLDAGGALRTSAAQSGMLR